MEKLIECVPNFSEGRRPEVVEKIVEWMQAVPGIQVLGYEMDGDHHRSVVTLVGSPPAIVNAAFQGIARATALINIQHHEGVHPRIGVSDVCPFIPLRNATMEDCIALARQLGARVGRELQVPVFLYAQAATTSASKDLANMRRGQLPVLRKRLANNELIPDFGPRELHPTAGAVAIGARFFLIAYNINLRSEDIGVAQKIAKSIREKDGGLPGVKALGLALAKRNRVQVSTNITDYRRTSLLQVFRAVRRQTQQLNIEIMDSELVGFAPLAAIEQTMRHSLQFADSLEAKIIENQLWQCSNPLSATHDFVQALASSSPTPGGGSAAALAGSMAAALAHMVLTITTTKKKYRHLVPELVPVTEQLMALQKKLLHLAQEDSRAYQSFIDAKKLPQADEKQCKVREEAMLKALLQSICIPMDTIRTVVALLAVLAQIVPKVHVHVVSDVGVACHLAIATAKSTALNVRINIKSIPDRDLVVATTRQLCQLLERAQRLHQTIIDQVEQAI